MRAGVTVSAIYTPGVGHFGHSYWQTYWGQIYLSQLADETGGEAYYIGFSGPPGVVRSISRGRGKAADAPVPTYVSGYAVEEGKLAANPTDDGGPECGSGGAGKGVGGPLEHLRKEDLDLRMIEPFSRRINDRRGMGHRCYGCEGNL